MSKDKPKPLWAWDDARPPDGESTSQAYLRLFNVPIPLYSEMEVLWDYGDGSVYRTPLAIIDIGCDHREIWKLEDEGYVLRNQM